MEESPVGPGENLFKSLDSIEEEGESDEIEDQSDLPSPLIPSVSDLDQRKTTSLAEFSVTDEYKNLKRKMNISLWESVESNDPETVKKLLDVEKYSNFIADPNATGLNNWTALHMASAYGYCEICEILITHTANINVNARTSIQRTPLHLATLHNQFSVVKLLVHNGADINLVDNELNTVLHYASMQGYYNIVEWILRKSPLLPKNNMGRTPVCLALNYETYSVFLEYSEENAVDLPNTGYVRNVLFRTLLHNSREDYTNKILAKLSQKMNTKDIKAFNERPKFVPQAKPKKSLEKFIIPPSKVGPNDFRGISQLGRGSFGEVYLVEKIDTGEHFALKVLRKEKVIGNNLVRYAFTERNILLHITHPFIVKLNFAFQTPEKLVMIMDFCPNGDLGTHLAREKKFSEEKSRFYIAEIMLALEELHKNGILFRDLKPENVVLDVDGHARLTDFGLSKEGVTDEQLSRSFCGSIAYLAPEMLKRSGHTRSVDWYLLGVLFYEMVCGSPPFYSSNRDQMFNNIQRAELKFPQTISPECKSLIKELMNREPMKRLGAGKRDAAEIKVHSFFNELDWDAILRKEIPPPPIKPIKRVPRVVTAEKMFGKIEVESTGQRVEGWSVLQPFKK